MHDTNLLEDQPIAWMPTPDVIERSQLTRFMRQVGVTTWDELYEFSIRDVEKFTEEVLKFLDIKFDPPYEKLLDTSGGVEFPNWFVREAGSPQAETRPVGRVSSAKDDLPQGRKAATKESRSSPSAGLNITTMCLDRWDGTDVNDQLAFLAEDEGGAPKWGGELYGWAYRRLAIQVIKCAAGLRSFGLRKGDAVGIHLPMIAETIVALLAINRIGAIAVPVFSGYGVEAVASRMNAVGAKALFTCDGFYRRGKFFNALEVASKAVARSATIKNVFVVRNTTEDVAVESSSPHFTEFSELWDMRKHGLRNGYAEPMSAEDPLIILYTSGTTGKPKGIAHTHASFPIKAAQDMAFGTDVGRGTRISWYTDIGWMMGPWLIYGALINGATICIYDGAPDYPTHDRMWEFCAKHKVEVLGISPTLVRALAAHEDTGAPADATGPQASLPARRDSDEGDDDSTRPASDARFASWQAGMPAVQSVGVAGTPEIRSRAPFERHDLSSLRMFASTGEPWNPAPWWWLFEKVGNSKLPIINYSGGTEIAGGILMGNPLLPIKPCSFPAPCPGMDVDILDEEGKPVGPNQVGELVIKQPWIGMARGFWQEKERYLDTYWRRFKNIWVHGDWAMRDKDGHWFILGRSDDTLKVAGKRVGPAEVESLLVAHPLVTEAAVIGVPDEAKGTAMVAFCVLSADAARTQTSRLPEREARKRDDDSTPEAPSSPEGDAAGGTPAFQSVDLAAELRSLVAKDMGKPLAPSKIHFVSALPKTRNAKVMRRVIRAAYLGEDAGDLSALENPGSVDEIAKLKS